MKIPFLKESSNSNLPLITLFVLLITLVGLVFVGYEHFLGPENKELAKALTALGREEEAMDRLERIKTIEETIEVKDE